MCVVDVRISDYQGVVNNVQQMCVVEVRIFDYQSVVDNVSAYLITRV